MKYLLFFISLNVYAIDAVYIDQIGNHNNVLVSQTGENKTGIININNDNNSINLEQKDTGEQYAIISASGGNKNIDVLQQGSGSHVANITLTGNSSSLNLLQTGNTQQSYSINFNCATVGGCQPIQIQQGN